MNVACVKSAQGLHKGCTRGSRSRVYVVRSGRVGVARVCALLLPNLHLKFEKILPYIYRGMIGVWYPKNQKKYGHKSVGVPELTSFLFLFYLHGRNQRRRPQRTARPRTRGTTNQGERTTPRRGGPGAHQKTGRKKTTPAPERGPGQNGRPRTTKTGPKPDHQATENEKPNTAKTPEATPAQTRDPPGRAPRTTEKKTGHRARPHDSGRSGAPCAPGGPALRDPPLSRFFFRWYNEATRRGEKQCRGSGAGAAPPAGVSGAGSPASRLQAR